MITVPVVQERLYIFLKESNAIENIFSPPTMSDLHNAAVFLRLESVALSDIVALQINIAPGKPLRDRVGINVRVGSYIAPPGGPDIVESVENCLLVAHIEGACPWMIHCHFLDIHPFMDGNGRTSRLLWAWMMLRNDKDPFAIPFLHRFYYQTLESVRINEVITSRPKL